MFACVFGSDFTLGRCIIIRFKNILVIHQAFSSRPLLDTCTHVLSNFIITRSLWDSYYCFHCTYKKTSQRHGTTFLSLNRSNRWHNWHSNSDLSSNTLLFSLYHRMFVVFRQKKTPKVFERSPWYWLNFSVCVRICI